MIITTTTMVLDVLPPLPLPPPFGLPLHNPPSPLVSEGNDDEIEIGKNLTPTQKFLFGDTAKASLLVAKEKVAVAEKVRFSENLNKLFSKVNAIFENNDQKPFDDAELLSGSEMTAIPHTQVMFKELNEGKLPNQLTFFSGGSSGRSSELQIHAVEKIGMLNESNNSFLEYLTTDYTREILAKNKMKIHLETGNIYYNNMNMQESMYDFLLAQHDKTKTLIDYEIDLSDNFDFYLNEIIASITINRNDMDTHSTSKSLFYHFNNLKLNLNEDAYKKDILSSRMTNTCWRFYRGQIGLILLIDCWQFPKVT